MTDIVDKRTRSRMMSGIKGKNTRPEILVRKALHAAGYRFRLHRRDLPGKPDIVLPGRKVAIFVHGCFWHSHKGCRYAKIPDTRREFWESKLASNAFRDQRAKIELLETKWRVFTVWECVTRANNVREKLPSILTEWIEGSETEGILEGDISNAE